MRSTPKGGVDARPGTLPIIVAVPWCRARPSTVCHSLCRTWHRLWSACRRKHRIKVALDTSRRCGKAANILGKGAVKDTYNLLADGIVKLVSDLAAGAGENLKAWASEQGLARYFGSSLKGEANIDWDDEAARRAFLNEVVADADRLLEMARQALESSGDETAQECLREAAELLVQLTHSGRQSHPATDRTAVCPNPPPGVRYLSTDEIEQVRKQFVDAACLAEKVGLDGIDLKLCHGYLGTELLRPANTRDDRWGGTFENRTRFLVEAFEEIRSRMSSSRFVLGSRISFHEGIRGGCGTGGPTSTAYDPSETFELIRLMHRLGLGYVNVSGSGIGAQDEEALEAEEEEVRTLWYERLTKSFIEQEGMRLTVIGSGYSGLGPDALSTASRRLRSGYTDLAGFGGQSFVAPLFPARARTGEPIDGCVGCWAIETTRRIDTRWVEAVKQSIRG